MEERKRFFPTAIKLKFHVRMSIRRYMDPVVRRNNESRSTHSDGIRSTLKWLRSRILFIIREWTHGSKPIASRDFDWKQNVNPNQLQLTVQSTVTLFFFSPSSFSFFSQVLIKFSYLFALFFFFFGLFFAFYVCLLYKSVFFLQIEMYVEVNSICLPMYLACIVLFIFIRLHVILLYF